MVWKRCGDDNTLFTLGSSEVSIIHTGAKKLNKIVSVSLSDK